MPSCPNSAYGLLRAAIQDPDPVLFLEPKRIYHAVKGNIEDFTSLPSLGSAQVIHPGHNLTLITWGAALSTSQKALAQLDLNAEVIDLQSLYPIDFDTIVDSVRKTRRLVVVHEAIKTCGIGAEIIAEVTRRCFFDLDAPPLRVTGIDTIFPTSKLEVGFLPNLESICYTIKQVMNPS